MKNIFGFFKSRRFKYGSFATIFTAGFVVVIIFLNIIAGLLTDRFVLKFDLTSTGVFNLNRESIKVIEELKEEVNIYVLAPEGEYPTYLKETLNRFKQKNSLYKVEYIDIDTNPSFLWEYQKTFTPARGDIIIDSAKRERLIEFGNMVIPSESGDRNIYRLEEMLVSGTINVTKETVPQIGFINGHGEMGADGSWNGLKSVFTNNGFECVDVMLKDKLDNKVEYLVIGNPSRDYTESDIKVLDDFLNNGYLYNKHMFVYLDPQVPALPNLEKYLEEWGVRINHDIVIESTDYSYNSQINLIPIYQKEMLGTFMQKNIMTIVPRSHSLDVLFTQRDNISVVPLLKTSDQAYSKTLGSTGTFNTTKESGDKAGPFDLVVSVVRQKKDEQNRTLANYIFVSGSYDIINQGLLTTSSLANSEFILSEIQATRLGKEEMYINSTKFIEIIALTLTETLSGILGNVLIFGFPALIALIGIIVFVRRRYL